MFCSLTVVQTCLKPVGSCRNGLPMKDALKQLEQHAVSIKVAGGQIG